MAITIPASARQAASDAVVDLIDAGSGPGLLVIRDGAAGDPDSAAAGSEVATLTFSDPAFGAADTDGIATASTITSDTSATGGTAGHFRVEDSDGNCVFQGTVTGTGGGGDLELSTTTIGAGATVAVTSMTFQAPEAQN